MSHYDCDYCGVNPKSNDEHSINCPENPRKKLIEKAWAIYCEETWTGNAVDFWMELPKNVQEYYIKRVEERNYD